MMELYKTLQNKVFMTISNDLVSALRLLSGVSNLLLGVKYKMLKCQV